jgi:TonB family protein
MMRDRAEPTIEALAALLTALPVAMILYSGIDVLTPPAPVAAPHVTVVAITVQPAPAPAVAPAPPPRLASAPVHEAVTVRAPAPVPVRLPVVPRAPRPVQRRPMGALAAAPEENVAPAAGMKPAPAALAVARVADPSADRLYTGLVHQVVERHKRNPDNAAYRMMHPSGTVTVVFTIARGGGVSDVGVAASGGADMLDRQAALIVAGCVFPPMPAAAFAGAATHRFQVQITFPPPYQAD